MTGEIERETGRETKRVLKGGCWVLARKKLGESRARRDRRKPKLGRGLEGRLATAKNQRGGL